MKMKTRFNADEYVQSHACSPKGRGCWAFKITGSDGMGSYTTLAEEWFAQTDTLSGAKQQAKKAGRSMASDTGRVRELIIDILP